MSFINSRKRSYLGVKSTTHDVGLSSRNVLPFGRVFETVSRIVPDEDVHVQQGKEGRRDFGITDHDTRTINTYSRLSFSTNFSGINTRSIYGPRTDAQLGIVSSGTASRRPSTPPSEIPFYSITCLGREDLPHPNKLRRRASSKRKSTSSQQKREDGVRDHINKLRQKQTGRPVSSLHVEDSSVQPLPNVESSTAVPYQFWTATARKISATKPSYPWTQAKTGGNFHSAAELSNSSLETPFYGHHLFSKEPSVQFQSSSLPAGLSTHVMNGGLQSAASAHIQKISPHSALSVNDDSHSLYTLSANVDNNHFPTVSPPYSEPLLEPPSLYLQYRYRYKTQFSYEEEAINIPRSDVYKTKLSDTPTFRYSRRILEE